MHKLRVEYFLYMPTLGVAIMDLLNDFCVSMQLLALLSVCNGNCNPPSSPVYMYNIKSRWISQGKQMQQKWMGVGMFLLFVPALKNVLSEL